MTRRDATQRQVHVVPVDGSNPLPRAGVAEFCLDCGQTMWSGRANTPHLAQVLATARRQHGVEAHGWRPLPAEVADAVSG
jgi:hypothetical protein